MTIKYKVARHGSRWVIEATGDGRDGDDDDTVIMTCGANPTYAEVVERIHHHRRMLDGRR